MKRWVLAVAVVAIAGTLAVVWWPESTPEAPRLDEPIPPLAATAPPERPNEAFLAVPAVAPDAGVHRATVTTSVSSTIELVRGNQLPPSRSPDNDFLRACQRAAEACLVRHPTFGAPPAAVRMQIVRGPRGVEFQADDHLFASKPEPPFAACVRDGLAHLSIGGLREGPRTCVLGGLQGVDQARQIAESAVRCLSPNMGLLTLEISWLQRVQDDRVENTGLQLRAEGGRLDLTTETCLRRSATLPPIHFTPEAAPDFSERRRTLELVLYDQDEQAGQLELSPLPPRAALSDAQQQELAGMERSADAPRAGVPSASRSTAERMQAERCLDLDPWSYRCYRLLAQAFTSLAKTRPSYRRRARYAWMRFIQTAPEGDPLIPEVKALLETPPAPGQ